MGQLIWWHKETLLKRLADFRKLLLMLGMVFCKLFCKLFHAFTKFWMNSHFSILVVLEYFLLRIQLTPPSSEVTSSATGLISCVTSSQCTPVYSEAQEQTPWSHVPPFWQFTRLHRLTSHRPPALKFLRFTIFLYCLFMGRLVFKGLPKCSSGSGISGLTMWHCRYIFM